MRKWIFASLAVLALTACAHAPDRGAMDRVNPRQTWIVGPEGAAIGQLVATEGPRGVMLRMEFAANALPPGWHGAHLHSVGDCSDRANGFQMSGAHVGHGRHHIEHGLMNPAGPDTGDLPNIFAPQAGAFGAEFYLPGATLSTDRKERRRTQLLDADGTALIIHASPDDQQTQPIGGAGARVACAALTRLP